jgi:outer membrane receptor for ferrienterochelin and colicins
MTDERRLLGRTNLRPMTGRSGVRPHHAVDRREPPIVFLASRARTRIVGSGLVLFLLGGSCTLVAQGSGVVRGTVTRAGTEGAVRDAVVSIEGTGHSAATDGRGRYTLRTVPAGQQDIMVRALGYQPQTRTILMDEGGSQVLDIALEPGATLLSEIVVQAPSRGPEPIVKAPAAVSSVDMAAASDLSITGQAPLVLAPLPGIDVVQSGINDFNVNTRGFNTSTNRRVLVLQDGRDLSFALLGSQEWMGLSVPLEDMARIEMVRGPGSALYGANAFSGVLDLRTPTAREVLGTKITAAGGELGSGRADLRHAGLFGSGRFGYLLSAGYDRSDTWTRSRTNLGDFAREYATAVDTLAYPVHAALPGYEQVPLSGQHKEAPPGAPGPAIGDRDALSSAYATARFDRYGDNGSLLTVEGGTARTQNETLVIGGGRVQIRESWRPWTRVAWDGSRLHAFAYYSGRISHDQVNLAPGDPIVDVSRVLHAEAQYNRGFAAGRGRIVIGGSVRDDYINTDTTLLAPALDDRNDQYYSLYAQAEYDLLSRLRVVGAARYDESNLFASQLSPKGAVVFSPNARQSFRLTVNRAFQTPSILQFFVGVPAAPPADFSPLEAGLRASPLGPALAGVPNGQLFTNSAAVPVLVRGNENLRVEHVTSLEFGYSQQVGARASFTLDAYYSQLSDFVTDILPGVNPVYAPWTAPVAVPEPVRGTVEAIVRQQLTAAGQPVAAAGLTRLQDGSTAIVLSVGNAGRAHEGGVEVGADFKVSEALDLQANYSWFSADVDASSLVPGTVVLPNTPGHKANFGVAYRNRWGLDARLWMRIVSGYDWAAGTFVGRVPPSQTVDASAGYIVNGNLRLHAVVTNLFDQRRYYFYGGSVIGRRVLAGVTAYF